MSKTLVIQPLPGIGDMVWHLPYLRAIADAAPDGKISVLTKRRSHGDEMLGDLPWVSDVYWLERAQGKEPSGRHDGLFGSVLLGRDLKQIGASTAWILHSSRRYLTATRLAGIEHRISYRDLPEEDQTRQPIEKAALLLRSQGLSFDPTPRFIPPESALLEVRRYYGSMPRPWLVLGIGSSEPFKRWPEENFAALTRAFTDRTGGSVIVVGGPDDKDAGERIVQNSRGAIVLALGRPLAQAAALAAASDAFLGNDSGMLNLAAATGVKAVGLFGGSPPLTQYPKLVALEPEGGAEYRVDRMAEIPVEAAMMALNEALG